MNKHETPPHKQRDGGTGKDALSWLQLIVGTLVVLFVLFVVVATVAYIFEVSWARTFLDGFWRIFDEGIERMRILAALLPLLVVAVAYLAYRADQWWKRAEWALDAATAELSAEEAKLPSNRRTLGLEAMRELGEMKLAPVKDEELFKTLTVHAMSIEAYRIVSRDQETVPNMDAGPTSGR